MPAEQPESDFKRHLIGAFISLTWTIKAFAEDSKLRRKCRADIQRISSLFEQLQEKARRKQKAA